jgi:CBS domain-containing protein
MAVSGWEERLFRRPVAWTRGHGCGELAALLTDAGPLRVRGAVAETCMVRRVGLLVARKLPGTLDLTSVAVPVGFDARAIRSVVAAVSGGPHSALAARVARQLGTALGLPALMACAYREAADRAGAEETLQQLAVEVSGIPHRLVEAPSVPVLVRQLPERSLLVFGAPGGSWFQRALFGRGARLRHAAPAGAVIVQQAPVRVFQHMEEPVFVAAQRTAEDVLRVHDEATMAVVDGGRLCGIVRRQALAAAHPATRVGTLVEWAPALRADQPLDAVAALVTVFGADPIPVVDRAGRMVGSVVVSPPAPEPAVAGPWLEEWDAADLARPPLYLGE